MEIKICPISSAVLWLQVSHVGGGGGGSVQSKVAINSTRLVSD